MPGNARYQTQLNVLNQTGGTAQQCNIDTKCKNKSRWDSYTS